MPPRGKQKLPADLEARIREARNHLLTRKEAATKIGISVWTLDKYRILFCIPPFPSANPERSIPLKWTPERVERLRRMIIDGLSPREAAEAFDVCRRSISLARQRYGLPRFQHQNNARVFWTQERIDRLKALRRKGTSYSKIAPVFRVTRGAIAGAVSRYLNEARP